jgi:hypothetical protein
LRLIQLQNQRFGSLVVVERTDSNRRGYARWLCICDCGNRTVALGDNLRHGRTRSCGCGRGKNILAETSDARSWRMRGLKASIIAQARYINPRTAPTSTPSLMDIAWAAGLYEGEGSCCRAGKSTARWSGLMVRISQKDTECLLKLQRLFGGTIGSETGGACSWGLCGVRARGFILTIYTLLTQRRRKQIRFAIDPTLAY